MNDSQRNVAILAAFSVCLIAASAAFVHRQLNPPRETDDLETLLAVRSDPRNLAPIEAPKLEAPAQAILDRDLFGPLVEVPESEEPESEPEPMAYRGGGYDYPSPAPWALPPAAYGALPPAEPGAWSGTPLPPQPDLSSPPKPPTDFGGAAPKPEAKKPGMSLTVTGVGGSGADRRVLVEDTETGRSEWVRPGGRAFGYEVDYATDRGAVVSRQGRSYVLELGANKPAEKPAAAEAPSAPDEAAPAADAGKEM